MVWRLLPVYAELSIEVLLGLIGLSEFSDVVGGGFGGHDDGGVTVAAHEHLDSGPASAFPVFGQAFLQEAEQMEGKDTDENVGLNPVLSLMAHRPHSQVGFEAAEAILGVGEVHVGVPHLRGFSEVAVAAHEVTAV